MIAAFARFDLAGMVAVRSRLLAPLLVVVLAAVVTPLSVLAVPAGAVIVSLQAGTLFLNDERGRLDQLYAVLPLRRSAVVLGRYASMLAAYAVVAVLATLLALAASSARGGAIDTSSLLALHEVSFIGVALALAVQLPCFFAVGFTRGRVMMYAPVVVLAGGAWVAQAVGLLDAPLPTALGGPLGLAGAVVLGVLALAVGAVVSIRLYARRSL